MPSLYPPLDQIREQLFETPVASTHADEEVDAAAEYDLKAEDVALPAYLTELIRRRARSQAEFDDDTPLASGQIRALTAIKDAQGNLIRRLGRDCAILLGSSLGGKVWSGWLVAQDIDYATDKDLLFEEEDGPIDPSATLIQSWNPIQAVLKGDEALLGRLPPARLAAVLTLADSDEGKQHLLPRPGQLGAWDLAPSMVVTTGTPLGDDQDPRHTYQAVYRELAAEFRAASTTTRTLHQGARTEGLRAWLMATFVKPAWTFGALTASGIFAVTAVVAFMHENAPEVQMTSYESKGPAAPGPNAGRGDAPLMFRVRMEDDQTLASLRKLVSQPGAALVTFEFHDNQVDTWLSLRRDSGIDAETFAQQIAKLPGVKKVERISQ